MRWRSRFELRVVIAGIAVCAAIGGSWRSPAALAVDVGELGQPRRDLTSAELTAFNEGQRLFTQKLPGIGPFFNDETCSDCHSSPTVGGSGTLEHTAVMGPGARDIQAYSRHSLPGWTAPIPPPNASHRVAPPLYGLGLIEQIPDASIRAACRSGHVDLAKSQGSLPPNTIARFGVKPFLGTVTDFAGSALFHESGVTNPVEGTTDDDAFADPEVDAKVVATLAAYVRGLQPPGRNGNDATGEAVFHSLGCAACHVPDMPPAIGVFSDFCVHAMGANLADGISDHEAKGDEYRTTPLWGLRFKTHFLHDGRSATLEDALTAHGGEALAAVNAYRNAPPEQREALIRFLKTL